MRRWGAFSWVIICFFQILNAAKYDYSICNYLVLLVNFILSFIYFSRVKYIFQNLASLILLIYIFFSSCLYPVFEITGEKYTNEEFESLAIFSNNLFLIYFASSILFNKRPPQKTENIDIVLQKPFSEGQIKLYFCIIFFLSFVSLVLGIGKMGAEGVQLPFRLSGIIQLLRTNVAPYIFMLIVAKKKIVINYNKWFLFYFLWGLFECYVRLSKASLLMNFLPLILYYILFNRRLDLLLVKKALPIFVVFFVLYPIIGNLRHVSNSNFVSSVNEAREMANEHSEEFFLVKPYTRLFMNGPRYMKATHYIDNTVFFDFSNLAEIILLGGSAAFTTYVIDGYPPEIHHSSGTTGLVDAFLIGGYGLCYFTLFLLVLFAFLIDKQKISKSLPMQILFLVLFVELVRGKTYTMLIDSLAFPTLVVLLLNIFIINKLYITPLDKKM